MIIDFEKKCRDYFMLIHFYITCEIKTSKSRTLPSFLDTTPIKKNIYRNVSKLVIAELRDCYEL